MDGGVVLRPVDDVDDERVTLPDLQRRPRVLPVHRDDVVRLAQPLHRRLLDLDDEQHHAQTPEQTNTAQHTPTDQAKKKNRYFQPRAGKKHVYHACTYYSRRVRRTYNELVVVHFGVCRAEQREREAREEEEQQPGRGRRRHGESETRRRCAAAGGLRLLLVAFLSRFPSLR